MSKPGCLPPLVPMLFALLVLLTGCGSTATMQTPAVVHRRWVEAVRDNDRAGALTLVGTSVPAGFVDHTLQVMHAHLTSPDLRTGSLQHVDILAPSHQGQDKLGISVWTFANLTWCYGTVLTPTENGWNVVDWGTVACPPDRA